MTNPPNDTAAGAAKIAFSWLLYAVGSITVQDVALFLAAVFSALQIYVLWRDKIRDKK